MSVMSPIMGRGLRRALSAFDTPRMAQTTLKMLSTYMKGTKSKMFMITEQRKSTRPWLT